MYFPKAGRFPTFLKPCTEEGLLTFDWMDGGKYRVARFGECFGDKLLQERTTGLVFMTAVVLPTRHQPS